MMWRKLLALPTAIGIMNAYLDAAEHARNHQYLLAEKKLLRAYDIWPKDGRAWAPVSLLMSLISLRLGNPLASAEMALASIGQIRAMTSYANGSERAYLSYVAGRLYEEATLSSGSPMTVDVGVHYDDLNMRKVRKILRETFPLSAQGTFGERQVH